MSIAVIRQLLEVQLNSIADSAIDTNWEGSTFNPIDGRPYQDVTLMFSKPENPTISTGFHRDKGILQVTLQYPLGTGPAAADARADIILAAFPYGKALTTTKITLVVSGTPFASPGRTDGNRWAIPVKIPFFANVFE